MRVCVCVRSGICGGEGGECVKGTAEKKRK